MPLGVPAETYRSALAFNAITCTVSLHALYYYTPCWTRQHLLQMQSHFSRVGSTNGSKNSCQPDLRHRWQSRGRTLPRCCTTQHPWQSSCQLAGVQQLNPAQYTALKIMKPSLPSPRFPCSSSVSKAGNTENADLHMAAVVRNGAGTRG